MNIVVVFGGKSVEHEISIISAFQVIEALEIKYKVIPIYISKDNEFYYDKKMKDVSYFKIDKNKCLKKNKVEFVNKKGKGYILHKHKKISFDMIFPIVHGKGSEDGSLLDYFRFKGFPIVGNNSLFYSLCQDKGMTKKVLDGLEIANVEYRLIKRGDDYTKKDFIFPCIVKPNNLGSSFGISVVNNFIQLEKAVVSCFRIDSEVLVEKYLSDCKEYNISVLNNQGVIEVSKIEEVKKGEIFSYEDKYLTGNKKCGWAGQLPFKSINDNIDDDVKKEIEESAKKIYKNFNASGVIRIDYLYKDKLYVNEINAIPGSYAYYLWEDKYDFLELLEIAIKEACRNHFLISRPNELISKNIIFNI